MTETMPVAIANGSSVATTPTASASPAMPVRTCSPVGESQIGQASAGRAQQSAPATTAISNVFSRRTIGIPRGPSVGAGIEPHNAQSFLWGRVLGDGAVETLRFAQG